MANMIRSEYVNIGIWILMIITGIICIILWYVTYNYKESPKQIQQEIYDTQEDGTHNYPSEEQIQEIIAENANTEAEITVESPIPSVSSNEIWSSIIADSCPNEQCNYWCGPMEYWDDKWCQTAKLYEKHANDCVTNPSSNLPNGYFVGNYLWDSGDCAGNDVFIGDYQNMTGRRIEKRCISGFMTCTQYYSDSCILSAGSCWCSD